MFWAILDEVTYIYIHDIVLANGNMSSFGKFSTKFPIYIHDIVLANGNMSGMENIFTQSRAAKSMGEKKPQCLNKFNNIDNAFHREAKYLALLNLFKH